MGPASLRKRIEAAMQKRQAAAFYTDMYRYSQPGFPLAVGEEWLLYHSLEGFHLDGYQLLRLRDIKRVHWWGMGSAYHRILKDKGVPSQVGLDFELDISNIRSILRKLKSRSQETLMIHFDYEGDDSLYVGRPIRLGQKTFTFAKITSGGKWEEEPERVAYDDVSMIEFQSEYGEAYGKYAGPYPKSSSA